MVSVEGPILSWLLGLAGPAGKRLRQRLAADHAPISGRQGNPSQQYMNFSAFIAVAPSNSAEPLPLVDRNDRVHEFVHGVFPGIFPEAPDHAGHELVRYITQPVGETDAQSRIIVYPTGLVELHWVLAAPPTLELPLDELVAVVSRLQEAVASGAFQQLHQPRRWEQQRRVDWRIGVNAMAATSGNSVYWEKVGPPELAPQKPDPGRRPSCPSEGYAAGELTAIKPKTKPQGILTPALADLLAAGGYSGGEEIRAAVARYLDHVEDAVFSRPGSAATVDTAAQDAGPTPKAEVRAPAVVSTPVPARPVTADEVIDAFRAARLPVPKPRDNSHNCSTSGCSQMITTDAITVVVFDDEQAATEYAAAASGDKHQRAYVVLSYAAARTPPEDRVRYERALDTLVVDGGRDLGSAERSS